VTLAPGTANIQQLLTDGHGLGDVLDALVESKAKKGTEVEVPRRPLPAVVPISDTQRTTLRTIVSKLDALQLPTSARLLTDVEKDTFIDLFGELKDALKVLGVGESALKETFHNHLDVELGTPGPDVKQDKNGHYVKAGSVGFPGKPVEVKREERGGKAASLTDSDLQRLESLGEIDHATYLAMTDAGVRNPNEAKIMSLLKKRPELLGALRKIATLTDKTTAISIRAVK